MITIGSYACEHIYNKRQDPTDFDFMCTEKEYDIVKETLLSQGATVVHEKYDSAAFKASDGYYEFYIGKDNNSTEQLLKYCNNPEDGVLFSTDAPLEVLYLLKMSHRYLRNSPHFLKTMRDIHTLRTLGASIPVELEPILKLREDETYDYKHPVLDVNKQQFFSGDGIEYIYDHDTIHIAIAIEDTPAYTKYIRNGSEVMTDKEKFFAQKPWTRLLGVYEETCVLALERSQIPFNFNSTELDVEPPTAKHSFITALIKVCTSITSGWFREYAYDHFYEVLNLYREMGEDDYIERFKENRSVLKPFDKNGM